MKKMIAVAALIAATFAAPIAPVQAGSMMSDNANCLIFPLLKKECHEMIKSDVSKAMGAPKAASVAVASTAKAVKWPVPMWMDCTRAAAGSGHLYDC